MRKRMASKGIYCCILRILLPPRINLIILKPIRRHAHRTTHSRTAPSVLPTNPSTACSSRLLTQRLHTTARSNIRRRPRSRLLARKPALRTPTTSTLAISTRTNAGIASAAAGSLIAALNVLHRLLILFLTAMPFSSLEIRQTPSLGVDVSHLLIALGVKRRELLPRRRSQSFLEITRYSPPPLACLLGNAVVGIEALGLV